jgi:hypothetical protein
LENLDAEMEINSAWETIRENIKISAKERLGYFEVSYGEVQSQEVKRGRG